MSTISVSFISVLDLYRSLKEKTNFSKIISENSFSFSPLENLQGYILSLCLSWYQLKTANGMRNESIGRINIVNILRVNCVD